MRDLSRDDRKTVDSLKARLTAVMGQEPSLWLRFVTLAEMVVGLLPAQRCSVHCASVLLHGVSQALSEAPCNAVELPASSAERTH